MLQNIWFVKDCLGENIPGSFNDKFHPSKAQSTKKLFSLLTDFVC